MTRNLRIYVLSCLVWSVLFFSVLNWALYAPEERNLYIIIAAITYGVGFGLAGWLLGRNDSARNTRLNLGFWYSVTSNAASLLVGGLWVLLFQRDEWPMLLIMFAIFSLVTVIASLGSRRSIKGINREQLFR